MLSVELLEDRCMLACVVDLVVRDNSTVLIAGENDNVHDHWVDDTGVTRITDYNREEGDRLVVYGHTVSISSIEVVENDTAIIIRSNQANGGAHDEDLLGVIVVEGVTDISEDDIEVEAGVFPSTPDKLGLRWKTELAKTR